MPVDVVNYDEFMTELQAFQARLGEFAEIAGAELRVVFEQGLMILQGEAADYPPQGPDVAYTRTGTLGREWISAGRVIEGRGLNLVGRVGNATPYGPYVMDPDKQAEWHADVWPTTEDVGRGTRDAVSDLLSRAGFRITKQVLGGIGT